MVFQKHTLAGAFLAGDDLFVKFLLLQIILERLF